MEEREKEERDRRRFSPWARHDPFQRHVGPNQRAKEEGRETLLPKIYGATGNTRTLLVTSWCTPRALTVLYIYIIWYKNIALFSSSFIANALSLSCPSFSRLFSLLFSRGRGKKVAWRHVTTTTIMPAPSYSPSRPPPLRRPLYSTYSTNALRHGVRACVLPRLLRHLRQTRITHSRLRPYQRSVDAYEFDNAGFSLFFFLIFHEREKDKLVIIFVVQLEWIIDELFSWLEDRNGYLNREGNWKKIKYGI